MRRAKSTAGHIREGGVLRMTMVTQKCAMFGCREPYYQTLAIAPATNVNLCFKHFVVEGGVVEEPEDDKELAPAS